MEHVGTLLALAIARMYLHEFSSSAANAGSARWTWDDYIGATMIVNDEREVLGGAPHARPVTNGLN